MDTFDWPSFLRRWSDQMLASSMAKNIPEGIRKSGYLGFPPATDEQIRAAEDRLGIPLPPSYKAFLKASNGWGKITRAIDELFPVEQVDWFRVITPSWVSVYDEPRNWESREPTPDDEYFAYGKAASDFREEHVRDTLQISAKGDAAVYLLNPQVISSDGEWEAWFMASWLPGAHRYRSFQEMMEREYASFAGIMHQQPEGLIGGLPAEFIDPPGTPGRRRKTPFLSTDGPSVAQLLEALDDPDFAVELFPRVKKRMRRGPPSTSKVAVEARRRVIEVLGRRKDPDTVPALVKMLSENEHWRVRIAAVDALNKIGGDQAVEALLTMLNEGANLSIHAMHGLKVHAPARLIPLLLDELERNSLITLPAAGMILAELGETRALPILARIIEDPEAAEQTIQLATKCVARFGSSGLFLLKYLINSSNPLVRKHTAWALPADPNLYRSLLSHPDEQVRDAMQLRLDLLPPTLAP